MAKAAHRITNRGWPATIPSHRLAHRGQLNRKLVGLTLHGDVVPARGEDIMGEGRYAGQVTSATYSPTLGCAVALGYVHRDFFEPGSAVAIRSQNADLSAKVTGLPFVE